MRDIARAIRRRRKAKGLSVPKLAAEAGLSSQTVYLIESGATPGKLDTLATLVRSLGCDVYLILIDQAGRTVARARAGGGK